jgi:hypothetical protein
LIDDYTVSFPTLFNGHPSDLNGSMPKPGVSKWGLILIGDWRKGMRLGKGKHKR